MKKVGLIILLLLSLKTLPVRSQSSKETGTAPMVYIVNDVKLSAAQGNTSQTTTGTGTLGILFRQKYLYGSVSFNVVNKNDNLTTTDSNEVKIFTNNLLIPENSGKGISSFSISLGWKSFCKYQVEDNWDNVSFFDWRRFGGYFYWQANNTTWTKDSITSNVSINSPGIYLTYLLLNLQLDNETKDKLYLTAFGGFQWRLLGGDYGQAGNQEIRKHFLNLKEDKVNFLASTFGVKLEFGKFFGKIQETYFYGKNDIPGFSGYQSVISLGANIDLNIPAHSVKPVDKK